MSSVSTSENSPSSDESTWLRLRTKLRSSSGITCDSIMLSIRAKVGLTLGLASHPNLIISIMCEGNCGVSAAGNDGLSKNQTFACQRHLAL